MLLDVNNTQISIACQQFVCNEFEYDANLNKLTFYFISQRKVTKPVHCTYCQSSSVVIHDNNTTYIKDIPFISGIHQFCRVKYNRYKCKYCNRVFSEHIGFRQPQTRITIRAAQWISNLLSHGLSISAVSQITNIHWDTIRKIHSNVIKQALNERMYALKQSGYKPTYLAVDEFAIHKGHTYATCVMDLKTGEVLWVGKGRAMQDFRKFFYEFDLKYLSEVKAVAMDMNASYNKLVEEYLPEVDIVYDRYHMQAQFGREVLGAVRLAEARKHKEVANQIKQTMHNEADITNRRKLKKEYKTEYRKYTNIKKSRWTILTNGSKLSEQSKSALNGILEEHKQLAICYAMKEEMCRLFELTNPDIAKTGWKAWFEAAKESGIDALVGFAKRKEKRLKGLIAHAIHPISTGKIEGLNNKIKVAKRVGYGYRNDEYFFDLVRYISLPRKFIVIPRKT